MGFTYSEVLDMPYTDMLNYIAIDQYKNDSKARLIYKKQYQTPDEEFDALLALK